MTEGTGRPGRDTAWHAVAARHDGTIDTTRRGGVRRVRVPHGAWSIVLDRHAATTGSTTVVYTRARAVAPTRLPVRMSVFRETFFSRMGKLFGMNDLTVGNPAIDPFFIVQGDNESVTRSLFAAPGLADRLHAAQPGRFEVARHRGRIGRAQHLTEVRFVVTGNVRDEVRLEALLGLLREALDGLARVGVIGGEAPAATA